MPRRVFVNLHNLGMQPSPFSTRPSALIDFRSPDSQSPPLHLAFGEPRETLCAHGLDEVTQVIGQAEARARAGAWCVGHLNYEAAPAFDAALTTHGHPADAGPLAQFHVYDAPLGPEAAARAWRPEAQHQATVRWDGEPPRAAFEAAMGAIQRAIAAGEYYQVNLTSALTGTLEGDPLVLFDRLRGAQPHAYAAYIAGLHDNTALLSVSPELFFDWRGGRLLARPMKGTAPRGHTPADDEAQRQALTASAKERAENVMIVDLLRNDLSRVAEPHTVRVPRLFHTEAWPTVWQLTSDIEARTRSGIELLDVFRALFPCGSVTGAPKVRAMAAIRSLEPVPRGVYCGAIGVLQPGGMATFNVPIRTLALRGQRVRCGIGSGITSDARVEGEWAEWKHKRLFADRASEAFDLLETLRLSDGELLHVEHHRARMAAAAVHFGFAWDAVAFEAAARALSAQHPTGMWRVRLLSDRAGRVQAQAYPLEPSPAEVTVQLAHTPLPNSDGEFCRHKTTRRAHYDAFAPTEPGVFDTLLWNERGEITEFTRGNVALKLKGEWLTPALSSGLLPGVARASLLQAHTLREAVLHTRDLADAQGLAFFNSLRGWIPARLGSTLPIPT